MGRIKSTLAKRTSRSLIAKRQDFRESFEDNKRILGNNMPSKKMRNVIAGYIARLVRQKRENALKPVKKVEATEEQI